MYVLLQSFCTKTLYINAKNCTALFVEFQEDSASLTDVECAALLALLANTANWIAARRAAFGRKEDPTFPVISFFAKLFFSFQRWSCCCVIPPNIVSSHPCARKPFLLVKSSQSQHFLGIMPLSGEANTIGRTFLNGKGGTLILQLWTNLCRNNITFLIIFYFVPIFSNKI